MSYEPKKDSGKDSGSVWRFVYGKIQYKSDLPTVNMGLLGGHIKKMDVLCKQWKCKRCKQMFRRNEDLIRYLKEGRSTGGKTKIICSGGKFRHILTSSEKVLYGGDTKFSYTACQWIEAEAVKIGKHIHHKMCGHGGERMVKVWVLDDIAKDDIAQDEYEQFLKMFKANDCTTMGDWLRVCNVADVVPFIEAFRKMAEQYYPDKIVICKDAVSIPGISMTYVLNKSLEKVKKLELYAPGGA